MEFQALSDFDAIEIKFDAGLAGALNNLRVYYAYINPSPLPVGLKDFSASMQNDNVTVNWTTASEQNNDFFTVERSADGFNYKSLSEIKGAGNSSAISNYEFTDHLPSDIIPFTSVYYRLSQTDFNGNTKTYSPVSVSVKNNIPLSVNVFPNPSVDGIIYANVSGTENKETLIVIADVLGKEYYSKLVNNAYGIYCLNSEQLPAGVYMITASSDDAIISKKIIIR